MRKKSSPTANANSPLKIYGTVHNQNKQPAPKLTVQVYSKRLRSIDLLGETLTDDTGTYTIECTSQTGPLSVIVKVYDAQNNLLKESSIQHNISESLQIDISLDGYRSNEVSQFDQLVNSVTPFSLDIHLSELTENSNHTDISFVAQKTNQSQDKIEKLAMAFRFEKFSPSVPASVWYGILCQKQAGLNTTIGESNDFETRLTATFEQLMHTPPETLMEALQKSIDANIITGRTADELAVTAKQLSTQILSYAKEHPVTGQPSSLYQKLKLGGLKGKDLDSFIELHNKHFGTGKDFLESVQQSDLKDNKNIEQLKSVFELSRLTNNNLELTEKLIASNKIKTQKDIKQLAAYDQKDWEALINEQGIKLKSASNGNDELQNKKHHAVQLESSFTKAFPTTAFASRLEKDKKSKLPHREKINKFLQENEHFDLLHTRIGRYMKENKHNVDEKDVPELEYHLRRTQRVFKLAPTYDAAHTLLSDNIHSAQQVRKMGKDNFVKSYSDALGEKEAEQVFENASEINATSVALLGDLQSMVDASPMNAFPDFSLAINQTLTQELPSLETLFGHTDFAETDEARSVYGAPAYLTDIMHFLDKRHSTLPLTGTKVPSVKDLLLKRRTDIADIDLESNNTNTEVPYIDIACELMEDFIAAPISAMFANTTFLPKLVKGPIDPALLSTIKSAFTSSGQSGFGNLLTAAATVSDKFTDSLLAADNTTYITQDHWIIRDSQIVIKVTNLGTNLQCRALHQTLLSTEAISTGPEFINTRAYDNFLKTAKRPFNLPFDLFETESELYLEKLGTKKADLIDIFSRTAQSPLHSTADINMGYASLGINQAEQTLIFQPDTANQSLYWGSDSTSTTITINVFEKLTGLTYAQIDNLLKLKFINPTKDSVIEHDDLTADTTKQRITNTTAAKLDAIHRFLRLWRKTPLTMDELDAFIVNMAFLVGGTPTLNTTIADQLRHFLLLQQSLQLTPFQLVAFYGDLDTSHNLQNCQYNLVYQNSAITNPVYSRFSIESTKTLSTLTDPDKLVICSILQISLSELNAMLSQTGTSSFLTVRTLSIAYMHAQLAHSLGISLAELLTLLRLIGPNPFSDPANTTQFINRYKQLLSFGFSIDDLNYILRHQNNADGTLIPTTDQRSAALTQLQNDLLSVRAISTVVVDPDGSLLNKWLTDPVLKWDISLVNRLMDILTTIDDDVYRQMIADNTNFLLNLRTCYNEDAVPKVDLSALPLVAGVPISFPASVSSQLSFDPDKKQLILKGVISVTDRDALLALSTDTAYRAAINSLYSKIITSSDPANIFFTSQSDVGAQLNNLLSSNIAARFAFFINKLFPNYRYRIQLAVVTNHIGIWFNIDKKLAALLAATSDINSDLMGSSAFVNKIIDTTTPGNPYPVQANRYQWLAKVIFILRKSNLLDDRILSFFLGNGPTMGCLDFRTLPTAVVGGSVSTFPGFEAFLNLLRFHQLYPTRIKPFSTGGEGRYNIFGVLTQTPGLPNDIPTALTAMKNNLAFAYGWNATDVQTLLTLNFTVLADFTAASTIMLRLHQSITVLQQLGISLADAQSWCAASLTSSDSAKIKNVLKAKYSSSDWVQVAKPLQDSLREKKRDALIAYLLANPGTQTWKNENDLYSYFLLDVEMCSCQPTSRIVQATNSVQLFVQRCFMGLESSIKVDTKADADWEQWKWMKNFRVWQANVKVFLYPENWIEPELLPKELKSPFLKELENDLLQTEVTADTAETAFQNYLEKLDNVARLEIKGMWYDDYSKNLHVFGRTYGGDPKIYYYRKFIEGRRWTPWVKVDLDINSDYIMPVVYNNRLYLFWSVITSQNKQSATMMMSMPGTTPVPAPQPVLQWQIQLASSEYNNGKWSPPKTSDNNDAGQVLCDQSLFPDRSRFLFAPLDIPLTDYADLFVFGGFLNPVLVPKDGIAALFQKIKTAINKNGTLMVSCYYYDTTSPANINAHKYISSFKLDIAKGYPVKTNFLIAYGFASSLFDSKIVLNQQNMIFVEPTAPPSTSQLYNTPTPNQSRGRFNKLVPFQLGMVSKMNYLQFLTEFTNFLSTGFLLPYFYQDQDRTYYVIPEYTNNADFEFRYEEYVKFAVFDYLNTGGTYDSTTYTKLFQTTSVKIRDRFFNFFHPKIKNFRERLFLKGIDGLMDRDTQLLGDPVYDLSTNQFKFSSFYSDLVATNTIYSGLSNLGYPIDDVNFSQQSGYGLYNWELFFHAPLMIAERLSQNHQFEAADRWYRYIFNPMDTSSNPSPDKYWNTKPFFINVNDKYTQQRIENILNGINNGNDQDLIRNVTDWRNNPFQPHYIAEYRTVAYQKVAVMKYIGHLVRHADYLFSQHTMESVNEATQLYIMAAEILGPKPQVIPSVAKTAVDNYGQLEQKLDVLSDALVDVENLLPQHTIKNYTGTIPNTQDLPSLRTLYFCVPMNENLAGPTGYWDIVADRLFKIRHCLDIDGNLSPLALFSAPIDPGLLVRATAAGLDIGSILNDVNAPLPTYRFMVMMQKTLELCNEVKTLGSLLLSVLEKKDTEAISLLRSGHEIKLLGAVLLLKRQQKQDAQAAKDSLDKQRDLIVIRREYYSDLTQKGLNSREKNALEMNEDSYSKTHDNPDKLFHAAIAGLLPNFTFGQSGISSPVTTFTFGGEALSKILENRASRASAEGVNKDKEASITNTRGSYQRRAEEWQYQLNLANKELEQIDKQIEAAKIRLEIAEQDLTNQQLQIDQAKETNDFMRSKFTNEELFNWMITQVSTTYFRSYQLAYEIAKKAERCFRYELGLDDSSYINFGYWDSLKKGLLAGEMLSLDLRKLELAYLDQNKRELELVKHVSLSQLDPVALMKLKTTGECWINLPEELFDMDYPGHYMRRIKSVSLTIPCITGPYTTVSCKLTMTKNSLRKSAVAGSEYSRKLSNGIPTDDPRFRDAVGSLQSIATSSAQNDSGLFELNFRDERYLPFEGAGAISLWHLELPAAVRQFDFETISDVIIHLKYTARDGGDALKASATTSLNTKINQMLVSIKDTGLMRIFSAKNDLPTEWYKFLHPANATDDQVLTVNLDKNRFPLFVQNKTVKIKSVELVADSAAPINNLQVLAPASSAVSVNLTAAGIYGSNMSGTVDYSTNKKDPGAWVIKNPVANSRLTETTIKNMVIIVHYEVS
jgi:hypothetical protein